MRAPAIHGNWLGQASEFPAAMLHYHEITASCVFTLPLYVKIQSGQHMELTLNLVWLVLAVLLVKHWLSHTARGRARTLTHIAALGMLILILFPVISVTDDLVAAQNPAELDCCVRRIDADFCTHSNLPTANASPRRRWLIIPLAFWGSMRRTPRRLLTLKLPQWPRFRIVRPPQLDSLPRFSKSVASLSSYQV